MQTVRSQLFEGITNEECARMFQCFGAREAGYEAGALISEFDGEQNAVGVLLSGSADLVRLDADGNRTILETLEEGGVFGEVLAFSGAGGDSIFLECRRDCRVLYLDYDQITKRCENACLHHSILVQNLFRLLSTKTLRLSERVEVLSRRSIREKLLCYFGTPARAAGEVGHHHAAVFPQRAGRVHQRRPQRHDARAEKAQGGGRRADGKPSCHHSIIKMQDNLHRKY